MDGQMDGWMSEWKSKENEPPRSCHSHSPDVVWHGDHGAAVQQDLQDLIVVLVGCQNERSDLRGEGRGVAVSLLPRLFVAGDGEAGAGRERGQATDRRQDEEKDKKRKWWRTLLVTKDMKVLITVE